MNRSINQRFHLNIFVIQPKAKKGVSQKIGPDYESVYFFNCRRYIWIVFSRP
jgi:hypothetical protein